MNRLWDILCVGYQHKQFGTSYRLNGFVGEMDRRFGEGTWLVIKAMDGDGLVPDFKAETMKERLNLPGKPSRFGWWSSLGNVKREVPWVRKPHASEAITALIELMDKRSDVRHLVLLCCCPRQGENVCHLDELSAEIASQSGVTVRYYRG
jgi:hypothetical protein